MLVTHHNIHLRHAARERDIARLHRQSGLLDRLLRSIGR
ncbi:MAG: hypothetical protein RL190_1968 [Actinomycetota bacterium]|jgi:hypothetical protein